ncbi:hypothetical protein AABM38_10730 [Heyndrickxia sp. MSNUG]|uniref:hypothetical protein n=1 Tax=Heyndrickxia sp. MSNUG TaxID=3136677 RepID=UPI003C2E5D52
MKPTIEIVFDKKSIAKLKAVAKHAGALAEELKKSRIARNVQDVGISWRLTNSSLKTNYYPYMHNVIPVGFLVVI